MNIIQKMRTVNASRRLASRKYTRSKWGDILMFLILAIGGLFSMLPLIYAICTSFKPLDELLIFPPTFFVKRPTLGNYKAGSYGCA